MGSNQSRDDYEELQHTVYDEYTEYGIIDKEDRYNFLNILKNNGSDEYDGLTYICGITITPPQCTDIGSGGLVIFDCISNMLLTEHICSNEGLYEEVDLHSNKLYYWYGDKPDDIVLKIIDIFVDSGFRELRLNFLFTLTFIDELLYREIIGISKYSLSKPIFKGDRCRCED